jgi:hypothetical protein
MDESTTDIRPWLGWEETVSGVTMIMSVTELLSFGSHCGARAGPRFRACRALALHSGHARGPVEFWDPPVTRRVWSRRLASGVLRRRAVRGTNGTPRDTHRCCATRWSAFATRPGDRLLTDYLPNLALCQGKTFSGPCSLVSVFRIRYPSCRSGRFSFTPCAPASSRARRCSRPRLGRWAPSGQHSVASQA